MSVLVKNILFNQGRASAAITEKIIDIFSADGHHIPAVIRKPSMQRQEFDKEPEVYFRDSLLKQDYVSIENKDPSLIYDVLNFSLRDPSTRHIIERKGRGSVFINESLLLIALKNIDAIFKKHDIDVYVSHVVPHNIAGWMTAIYCHYLHIPHYYARPSTVIPGRAILLHDGVTPEIVYKVSETSPESSVEIKDNVDSLLGHMRKSYSHIMPSYEKGRRESHSGFIKSLMTDASFLLKKPKSFNEVLNRRRYFNFVKNRSSYLCKDDNIFTVSLFFHYQPERTTMPEADWLAQQFFVASMVSDFVTRNNGRLILKEHPSQFLRPIDKRFRSLDFYKKMTDLKSSYWASPLSSPTDIIDMSDVIITGGGTVSLEALSRNVPVAYFNRVTMGNLHGMQRFSSYNELERILKEVKDGALFVKQSALTSSLIEFWRATYPVDLKENLSISAFMEISKKIAC